MSYRDFLLRHPRILFFGILLTLFSSFGQTFLISLFVPEMMSAFSLNSGQFGTIYALATLGSAICLPFLGRSLDRMDLGRFSFLTATGLVLACFVVASSPHFLVLFLGLFGLRLCGQGLLTLTASTAMARTFTEFRGRALSISALGYPLGEGLFPLGVVLILHTFGWRITWGLLGVVIAIILLPAITYLISAFPPRRSETIAAMDAAPLQRRALFRDPRFYLLLPNALILPFLLTGLFLYQTSLAEFKGWPIGVMAKGFIGFAVMRMLFSFLSGPWIDRWGPQSFLTFSLIPVMAGITSLYMVTASWGALVFFLLAGISQGMIGVMMTAIWAQVYGTETLGQVKGLVIMLITVSAALAPAVFGWLLAGGISFAILLPALIGLCVIGTLINEVARKSVFSR